MPMLSKLQRPIAAKTALVAGQRHATKWIAAARFGAFASAAAPGSAGQRWRATAEAQRATGREAAGWLVACLGLAGLGVAAGRVTRCEEGPDVKLCSYNVLAPQLAPVSKYPRSRPEDVDAEQRLAKVLVWLDHAVASGTVIALQEVDLQWAGKLHAHLAERDYVAIFGQHGHKFNNFMGVMVAWPRHVYEAMNVEICRLSSSQSMKEVLSRMSEGAAETWEWTTAEQRGNEAIFVRLRLRGMPSRSFVVATYHMPCLFGSASKVRVMNIHAVLLLRELHRFAGDDPLVLMGDFNVQPETTPYCMIATGGEYERCASTARLTEEFRGQYEAADELKGLSQRLGNHLAFPGGLASAYRSLHGQEPKFTNYHGDFSATLDYIWFTPGRGLGVAACPPLPDAHQATDGPFPSSTQPSDHLPVEATLKFI